VIFIAPRYLSRRDIYRAAIFIAPQPLSFAKIPIFSKHLASLLTHHQA